MWLRNIRKQKVVVLAVLFGFLATGLGLVPAPALVQASPADMSLQVGTGAETYDIGDTVQVTATATVDGAPVSGAQVAFEIRDQEGHVKYVDQLATGASGQAVMTYRLVDTPVSKVEPGTYTIWARASWGGRTSQATATFAVQAAVTPPAVPVLTTLTLGGTPPAGFKVGDTFDLSSLTLTATDQNGQPYDLAGKTVTWASSNTAVATVSGSTLAAVAAGTTQVTATVEGVISNPLTFTVVAPATGAISGTVTYRGQPQADVRVVISAISRSTVTDNEGRYSFADLSPGSYQVTVVAQQGFTRQEKAVTVTGGQTAQCDFDLLKGGTITGTVTDTSGNPLEGIEITIDSAGHSGEQGYIAYAVTGADGTFWLDGLRTAGDYVLTTWNNQGYVDETLTDIPVTHGQKTDLGTVQLQSAASQWAGIRGTVKDQDGNGLENIYVEAWSTETGSWASDTTDAQGQYELTGLLPGGGYSLYAWGQVGNSYVSASGDNLSLAAGETLTGQDLVIELGYSITGAVYGDPIGEGPVIPLEGVEVSAWSDEGGWAWARTGTDGAYTLENLRSGAYHLSTYNNKFYLDQTVEDVAVYDGDVTRDLTLAEGGRLTGRVVDSQNTGIEGARISIYSASEGSGSWAGATTDAGGNFTLRGLKTAGDFYLYIWKAGYQGVELENRSAQEGTEQQIAGSPFTLLREDEALQAFYGDGNSFQALQRIAAPGDTVTFRASYRNNSVVAASNARLAVTLPADLAYVDGSSSRPVSATASGLEVALGDVAAGAGGIVLFQARVSQSATATELTAGAAVNFEQGTGGQDLSDSLGVAVVEVLHATINGPATGTPTEQVKLYGECSQDALVTVYAKKDGGAPQVLKRTSVQGRWWTATVDFSAPQLGAGTYTLYAVASVGGRSSGASDEITLVVSDTVPVVEQAKVRSGGNEVTSNPYTSVPAMAVWQGTQVDIEVQFVADGGEPQQVSASFLSSPVSMAGSNKVYAGSFTVPTTAFGDVPVKLLYRDASGNSYETTIAELTILIDPSGYVYDEATNSRLAGVTAVVQQKQADDTWRNWDAARFGQINPQLTDEQGRYGWDVPAGTYRVIFSKDGYETYTSGEVVVPPPETELNIGLVALEGARLASLTLQGTPPASFTVGSTFNLNTLSLSGYDQNSDHYDLAGKTVTWHSSNTAVATVSGSTLTAVGAGTTQVTATVEGVTSNALTFTVSAAPTGAGGGGGGAAPTAPAAPAGVAVDKVEVQRQLGAGAKVVVAEVPATAAEHSVALNRDAVQALVAARVPLQVKTAGALVEIPAAALVVPDTGAELRVKAQAVASAEAQQILPAAGPLRSAGSVVDITVETAKGQTRQAVARFSQPVKVRLSYSTAGVNEARLGAYRYDEVAKAWNYIRSKVDTANKVVEFTTDHFSKYTVMEYSKTFADIASHWAKPEIELMASRWVVKGVDEERFNPEGNVTRAEFAAMLVRAMGIAAPANATAVFSDAQPGQWFFAEVMAAYNAGLVQGYGEGRFGPNDRITREQVVTMVVRAMAREGKAPKLTSQQVQATLSGFADLDELSAWAWEASAVGVETGLVKGRTSTTLNPRASSTRAEAAVLMKRLLEKLE
ncbi:MAG: DUF11 domain-containing protein [Clostridia bacterium]|nr:MAG: DUF11 domain-containing protein [Clostridia bacterium]